MTLNTGLTRRRALALGGGAAAAAAFGMPVFAQSRLRMTIATGGTGGVFYPYGGGLARILTEKAPNVQATAQVTGGSVDNVKLLNAGEAEIGFCTIDSAYDAIQGTGAYAKEGKQNIAVLAVLYDSFFHIIAAQSEGFKKVADFKGKRIGVGSPGSSTEGLADRVLEAAGLDPKQDINRENLGVTESVNALKDGKISAFFWIGGLPTAAVRDLATTGQPAISFIPASEELKTLSAKFPGLYSAYALPKTVYAGVPEDVPGIGIANVLLVSSKAEDAIVTTFLETIFANLEEVQKIHPEAKKLTLNTASVKTAVPFHPAAEKFYKAKA